MKPHYLFDDATRAQTIRDDFAENDERKKRADEVCKMMLGEEAALNNPSYEAMGYFLPQLVFTNPSLKVKSAIPGEPRHYAVGGQFALESMSREADWPSLWQQCVADMLVWEGVLIVSTESVSPPNYMVGRHRTTWNGSRVKVSRDDTMGRPRMSYIDRNNFFIDRSARRYDEARHMGHCWMEDLADLRARAEEGSEGWIKSALERVDEERGNKDKGKIKVCQMFVPGFIDERAQDNLAKRKAEEREGEEVEGYDPKLHTGTIYTFGGSQFSTEIREPRLYRGPKCGPYVLFQGPPLPFQRGGAGHFSITFPQVYNAARVDNAILDAIDDYKVFGLATQTVMAALKGIPHNGVYGVTKGELTKEMLQTMQVGGVTADLNAARLYTSEAVDRTVGISDSMRGVASKGTTATAETLADQSTDIRLSSVREQVYKAVQRALYIAYWHIDHDDTFMQMLPPEAAGPALESVKGSIRAYLQEENGAVTPEDEERLANLTEAQVREMPLVFTGGEALRPDHEDGYNDWAHDARSVEIEPMSMERTTEHLQQRRALQFMEVVKMAAEVAMLVPGTDLKGLVDDLGGALNLPDYGKRLGDPQAQPAQGQPTPGGQQQPMGTAERPGFQAGAQAAIR